MRMHPRLLFRMQYIMFRRLEKLLLRRQCGAVIACLRMRQARQFEQFADFFRRRIRTFDFEFGNKISIFLSDAHADWDTVRCIHIRLFWFVFI